MNEWPCLDKKAKHTFKTMLVNYGYSEKVANELCKWYTFSEKKGIASYWEHYTRILLNLFHKPLISEGNFKKQLTFIPSTSEKEDAFYPRLDGYNYIQD